MDGTKHESTWLTALDLYVQIEKQSFSESVIPPSILAARSGAKSSQLQEICSRLPAEQAWTKSESKTEDTQKLWWNQLVTLG